MPTNSNDSPIIPDVHMAAELLRHTPIPRDSLPYTEEFDRLHDLYCTRTGHRLHKRELMQTFFNLGKKGGFAGRKSGLHAPELTVGQMVYIGKRIGSSLGSRASIVYSCEFDDLHHSFCQHFTLPVTKSQFWLAIDAMGKRVKGEEWAAQLKKAKESACLAAEIYNKPLVSFRSHAYIVLMSIAWTSLFHAMFFRWGIQPFYRKSNQSEQYEKVDGDYKAWELASCLQEYFGGEDSAVRQNLRFFIGLRNKIEHRCLPALDVRIFGECQAMLLNFEDWLFREFGPEHAIAVTCSPKVDPSVMRVSMARDGRAGGSDEEETAQSRTDRRQVA